ncbi:alkaline phosphatase D family protein [Ekhidna sp. To15]|uniref:alkaline phosphatase D family protein n=1 Tax=Ekhidna sp. To15 TaxID=3395267 RepID=UPI003F522FC9
MKTILALLTLLPVLLFAQNADITSNKEITRIAFGSCSVQDLPEKQLWSEVSSTNPDLWIWLGDNIYGDTEDMEKMKEKYDLQKSHPDYQKLLRKTDVIGIWDDHDYGVNDGGKEFPAKEGSKNQLFDFLDVDKNHPAQKRQGAHQSYTYKSNQGNVKIILLDTRYFRDSLKWLNPGTRDKAALINEDGDILGDQQWQWFENQLAEADIDLFIVASGIQVIPYQHRWEKWANFPKSRKKLLDVIANTNAPLILLSGDRHLSEVSKMDVPGYGYPLYELTSSSLTSPAGVDGEQNQFIVKGKIYEPNFASLSIMWIRNNPTLNLTYKAKESKELAKYRIQYE